MIRNFWYRCKFKIRYQRWQIVFSLSLLFLLVLWIVQKPGTSPEQQSNQHPDNVQSLQLSINQHPSEASAGSCSPHTSVSYVKIHKTGSGALHNLFTRRALRYNLTAALPTCFQIFPDPPHHKWIINQAPLKNYSHYNVFTDHASFNKVTQLPYMADDVRFITQIREPFSQAESTFYHFQTARKYMLEKKPSPLTTLLNADLREMTSIGGQCYHQRRFSVTRNFQALTLGYTHASSNNLTHFKEYLRQLDSELFFVSLLEYSDESMVLLRRKMCWHIRDVLTIPSHRTKRVAQDTSSGISAAAALEQAMRIHKQLSALDYLLYEHFQQQLLSMIKQQGAAFQEELRLYRSLNVRFNELCCSMCEEFSALKNRSIASIRHLLDEGGEDIQATAFHPAFRLTYMDCLLQKTREQNVKTILKVHQYPIACTEHRQDDLKKYRLYKQDCDFRNHVFPGYHINKFNYEILNKEICLGTYYRG